MLPPFHIRNLQPSSVPKESQESQDTLVRIKAPCYDETISTHPAATLKYYDEDDGDLITLGSSGELSEKLKEPLLPPSSGLLPNLQHNIQFPEYHMFQIDDRDSIRKLWKDVQSSSRDSGNVSDAQDRADVIKWSTEKKSRLALFYDRRRAEIWSPIAEELGVTWESADAMHWALGKEEIARRAYERNTQSEQSGSFEEIAKVKPNSTCNAAGTQQFEDYRVHHFNATSPPQVQLSVPLIPQPALAAAWIPKVSNVDLDCSASSIMGENGEVNLVAEGKRQVQAAGEKLRSRMTAVDSHHNRWANYKQLTSGFPPASTSVSLAFDGPGLTSEGKRQAQVAGDKLRWRTNPIRHSRPSRAGALEHGISKNRWSSYGGTRAARFDEGQDAQDEASETSNTANDEEEPKIGHPSLLEVFEAELAKKISVTDSEEAMGSTSPAVRTPLPEPAMQVDPLSESQGQPLPRTSQTLLGLTKEHLHELNAGDMALSQGIPTAIDRGIRIAASGLGACIQSVVRGLQEVSNVSRQAADRTRIVDSQLIDDAVLGFQCLTEGFATALRREMAINPAGTTSTPLSGPEDVENDSRSTTLDPSHGNDLEEDAITAHESNRSTLNRSDDPSKMVHNPGPNHAAAPKNISESPTSPQLETESQPRSGTAMSKEPRFHEPGPIHLPSCSGYVDHLRQSQSSNIFDEPHNIQRASSPPLDTHFPMLAQFEGENFGAFPTFPALPNMQPLVPQRSPGQSRDSRPTNGNLPVVSSSNSAKASRRSHDTVTVRHEHSAQRHRHEVIPLNRMNSAARLAGPFDPLEAELSARPRLTEGLRRNATVASTDIRQAVRRRRPYSEVFDGSGRVPWGTFLEDNDCEHRNLYEASDDRGRPLGANQEHPKRLSRPEAGSRRSPFAAAGYDDQHYDVSTVGKISDCVSQLRDLGFGGEDGDSAGRLLIYAQAAGGVLVDAIDLIEAEQQAWQRL